MTQDFTGAGHDMDGTKHDSQSKLSKKNQKANKTLFNDDEDIDFTNNIMKSSSSIQVTDNENGKMSIFDTRDISSIKKKDNIKRSNKKRGNYDYQNDD